MAWVRTRVDFLALYNFLAFPLNETDCRTAFQLANDPRLPQDDNNNTVQMHEGRGGFELSPRTRKRIQKGSRCGIGFGRSTSTSTFIYSISKIRLKYWEGTASQLWSDHIRLVVWINDLLHIARYTGLYVRISWTSNSKRLEWVLKGTVWDHASVSSCDVLRWDFTNF